MDFDRYDHVRPIRWEASVLHLLDQRVLPFRVEYVACRDSHEVSEAIRALVVRGAPAIGIAAAYGVVLAARGVAPAGASASRPRPARSRPRTWPRTGTWASWART